MANDFNSIAEQIKQLKQLLDIGAISNEEYEIKKNALLNPEKEAKYQESLDLIKASTYDSLSKAIKLLNSILEYRDSKQLLIGLDEKAEESRKSELLIDGIKQKSFDTIDYLQKAIATFEEISNYKNSNELINECYKRIEEINADNEIKKQKDLERVEHAKAKAKKVKKILVLVSVLLVSCFVFAVLLYAVIIPNTKYNNALKLQNTGNYNEAIAVFTELGDYKESYEQITECKYSIAKLYLESGKYTDAYNAFKELEGYKDVNSLLNGNEYLVYEAKKEVYAVGNDVEFGDYTWTVLAQDNDKALLITKTCISEEPYNYVNNSHTFKSITWEKCELRNWLNNEFYSEFTKQEQSKIITTKVINDNNPQLGTDGGRDTTDKIFILSVDEAKKYFSTNDSRKPEHNSNPLISIPSEWWLRTPGENYTAKSYVSNDPNPYYYIVNISYVNDNGEIDMEGHRMVGFLGVRPAMWISLK